MKCLPNRHHGVVVAPRVLHGERMPMDFALNGMIGVVSTEDIQGKKVLSAYSPIGESGLGMVLKIQAQELYAPIRMRFTIMLLSLIALILAGLALFRVHISPIARKLVHEIEERKRAQTELNKLSYVLDKSPVAVVIANKDGRTEYVNPTFTTQTGYGHNEAVGRTPGSMLRSGKTAPDTYRQMWGRLRSGEGWTGEIENRRKNGELYWVNEMILPVFGRDGEVTHYLAMQQDITDRKIAEAHLKYLANHDPLTGLPNRTLFNDRLKQAMIDATRHERLVGIMFLDLDRFKTINDTLGHSAGDEMLKQVTGRLTANVRPGDTISRLGGDEFTLILSDVAHIEDLIGIAQKILNSFAAPFAILGNEIFISGSIGITVYPFDDLDPESLVRNADAAMYLAKESGRNTYQFYTAELNRRASRRLSLESALRHAISRNEFRMHYQPQIDLASGRISGVEALIRWERPGAGLVAPTEFIPLAEDTGLIVSIGEWALRAACEQGAKWHAMGFDSLRVAVNISSRQFQDPALAQTIRLVLNATDFNPERLDLEITESVLIKSVNAAVETMEAMKAIGVCFSLDDFGTGYSSLNYLQQLPIESLKLDRTFVQDCATEQRTSALAEGIISMARALGIKVIAEGVENNTQLDFLRTRGCDSVQGFYFSRPVPATEVTAMLNQKTRDADRAETAPI